MLFSNIALLTPDQPPREGMFVATKGGRIVHVADHRPEGNFGEEYDGRGKLLIPGLVNGHCHVPMTLVRGYGTGLPLKDWLETSTSLHLTTSQTAVLYFLLGNGRSNTCLLYTSKLNNILVLCHRRLRKLCWLRRPC